MSEEKYAHYERRNTTKGLAGRYFERSKPRSRGCGEEMSKHHHARDTGERSVLLSRHYDSGSVSGSIPYGKCRLEVIQVNANFKRSVAMKRIMTNRHVVIVAIILSCLSVWTVQCVAAGKEKND